MDTPFDTAYICAVNGFVSRNESLQWGVLRTGSIGISGTSYKPQVPDCAGVERELTGLLEIENPGKQAISLFLWVCRSQLFWDGNKRTAALCANRLLIRAGAGVFTIREPLLLEFHQRLTAFYDTGDTSLLDTWLYEHCIEGIDFSPALP